MKPSKFGSKETGKNDRGRLIRATTVFDRLAKEQEPERFERLGLRFPKCRRIRYRDRTSMQKHHLSECSLGGVAFVAVGRVFSLFGSATRGEPPKRIGKPISLPLATTPIIRNHRSLVRCDRSSGFMQERVFFNQRTQFDSIETPFRRSRRS